MSNWVIPLKDIPLDKPIHRSIIENTDITLKIKEFNKNKTKLFESVKLNIDSEVLSRNAREAIALFGLFQAKIASSFQIDVKDANYLSSSLTYNPHAIDSLGENPHQSTLGSTEVESGSFSESLKWEKRNNYTDTYAFTERTDLSRFKEIGILIDSFQRTLIRSRLSVMKGGSLSGDYDYNWHNDESLFFNLRINIPICTTPHHFIQVMEADDVADSIKIHEFHQPVGMACVFNTELPHRPICKKEISLDRIHLICGISPWFDFDSQEKVWRSNEYYGEIHPFDMLKEGCISSLIKS